MASVRLAAGIFALIIVLVVWYFRHYQQKALG
jgi:hypothetical protein